MAHHECGLETAPLPVQLMAAAAGTTYGGAWEQQPLWRLQSAPVTLHLTSADSVRSSTGCVYMYAALQDKSLHKYKLVVPPTMPAAQAKVRLSPPTVLLIDLCCGPQLYAALGVLLPINANLRDIDARQMSSSVIITEASRGSIPELPPPPPPPPLSRGVVCSAGHNEALVGMQLLTRSCIMAHHLHSALKSDCHVIPAESQHLPCHTDAGVATAEPRQRLPYAEGLQGPAG